MKKQQAENSEIEDVLAWEAIVNNALSELSNALISRSPSLEEFSHLFLEHAILLTGSENGFATSIDPETGKNVVRTSIGENVIPIPEKYTERISFQKDKDGKFPGLLGHALNTRKAFYTNSPETHPSYKGLPQSHPRLVYFLASPAVIGEDVFGMIALSNPPVPYTDRDMDAVNRISSLYALAIRHQRMQDELSLHQHRLEELVEKRTQELLKVNEQYRALLDAIPDLMFCVDLEGKFLDFRGSKNRLLIPPEVIIGSNINDVPLLDQYKSHALTLIRHVINTGEAKHFEYHADVDGVTHYYEARIVKSETNEAVCLIRDISEKKLYAEKFEKERDFSKKIIDTSPAFFAAIDAKGKTLMMNKAMLHAIGWKEEEVIGKDYVSTFIPDDERQNIKSIFSKLSKETKPTINDNSILTRTGEKLLVEWHGQQVWKPDGELDFFFGIGINITSRKAVEDALIESEERFHHLTELLPQSIFELDNKGLIVYANQASFKMFGYTQEDLEKGLNVNEIIIPEDRKRAQENLIRLLKGDKIGGSEYTAVRKDKSTFPAIIYSNAIISNGKSLGIRGILIDISERKEAEEKEKNYLQQLMQADKMISLGTLVSGVAHEINNPNNAIMFNSPLLKDMFDELVQHISEQCRCSEDIQIGGMPFFEMKQTANNLFDGMIRSSERIKNIVSDLKNFARPDYFGLNQQVNVNEVLKSSITLLNNMIRKSTRNFSVIYGENLPKVKGNFQRLEQVVINLLQNACQAIENKEKTIRVESIFEENAVHILVKDEGVGIPMNQLKFLTDPFFTTKRDKGGTGLGLSITARIIKDHGGTLDIQSKPGKGSTFRVILPIQSTGNQENENQFIREEQKQ